MWEMEINKNYVSQATEQLSKSKKKKKKSKYHILVNDDDNLNTKEAGFRIVGCS